MTVLSEFYDWIVGIEEDTPLPYEISCIYFCISFSNNICSLCYGGNEFFDNNTINFDYFPLEAQFFFNSEFNNLKEINLAMLVLKQNLDECFFNVQFNKIFSNKTILIGEYGKENIVYKS